MWRIWLTTSTEPEKLASLCISVFADLYTNSPQISVSSGIQPALLAQLVDHWTDNQRAAGLIPVAKGKIPWWQFDLGHCFWRSIIHQSEEIVNLLQRNLLVLVWYPGMQVMWTMKNITQKGIETSKQSAGILHEMLQHLISQILRSNCQFLAI